MSNRSNPHFSIGEVCILQPPHPSAAHLWGQETTIQQIIWSDHRGDDAMGVKDPGYCYQTDIPAPPPTDLPEDQHDGWIWCEYDLRKKLDPGESLENILEEIEDLTVKI